MFTSLGFIECLHCLKVLNYYKKHENTFNVLWHLKKIEDSFWQWKNNLIILIQFLFSKKKTEYILITIFSCLHRESIIVLLKL